MSSGAGGHPSGRSGGSARRSTPGRRSRRSSPGRWWTCSRRAMPIEPDAFGFTDERFLIFHMLDCLEANRQVEDVLAQRYTGHRARDEVKILAPVLLVVMFDCG